MRADLRHLDGRELHEGRRAQVLWELSGSACEGAWGDPDRPCKGAHGLVVWALSPPRDEAAALGDGRVSGHGRDPPRLGSPGKSAPGSAGRLDGYVASRSKRKTTPTRAGPRRPRPRPCHCPHPWRRRVGSNRRMSGLRPGGPRRRTRTTLTHHLTGLYYAAEQVRRGGDSAIPSGSPSAWPFTSLNKAS